jgi:hypothetical protein
MESLTHMSFVKKIADYVSTIPHDFTRNLLCVELPGEYNRCPQIIGGSIPDVFYNDSNYIILGEAKTDNDIDQEHTHRQLNDYINEARTYDADRNIVLCTSIMGFSRMKNIIVTKKKKEQLDDIKFHVIDCYNKVQIL